MQVRQLNALSAQRLQRTGALRRCGGLHVKPRQVGAAAEVQVRRRQRQRVWNAL